jgi:hypothetical protein
MQSLHLQSQERNTSSSAQASATAPDCKPPKCACGRPAASGSSQCAGCRDISQFAAMVGGAK